jgi:hypothetical protein
VAYESDRLYQHMTFHSPSLTFPLRELPVSDLDSASFPESIQANSRIVSLYRPSSYAFVFHGTLDLGFSIKVLFHWKSSSQECNILSSLTFRQWKIYLPFMHFLRIQLPQKLDHAGVTFSTQSEAEEREHRMRILIHASWRTVMSSWRCSGLRHPVIS